MPDKRNVEIDDLLPTRSQAIEWLRKTANELQAFQARLDEDEAPTFADVSALDDAISRVRLVSASLAREEERAAT